MRIWPSSPVHRVEADPGRPGRNVRRARAVVKCRVLTRLGCVLAEKKLSVRSTDVLVSLIAAVVAPLCYGLASAMQAIAVRAARRPPGSEGSGAFAAVDP